MSEFRSEDLAPLLVPPPGPALGFRTGTVVAWNVTTGANTINVAGTELADLPILNNTDVVDIEPGDVVAVMRAGASYFILGRILIPGAASLARGADKLETAFKQDSGFALATGAGTAYTLASGIVPEGYTRVISISTLNVSAKNTTAAADSLECGFSFGTGGTRQAGPAGTFVATSLQTATASAMTPGDPWSISYVLKSSGAAWPADPGNSLYASSLLIWKKE